MSEEKNKTHSILIFVMLIVLFGLIAGLATTNNIEWFDKPIIDFIQSSETPALTDMMIFFTSIGSIEGVITISIISLLVIYLILKYRKESLIFVIAILGSTVLNQTLKNIFQRERPTGYRLIEETGYSFPSGHAMAAFTLYLTLTLIIWNNTNSKLGHILVFISAISMILLIGISRIYLGVHYPSDIIAGYIASAIWLLVLFTISHRMSKEK